MSYIKWSPEATQNIQALLNKEYFINNNSNVIQIYPSDK